MVWRLATGNRDWWKEVIRKIYIMKPCSTILSHPWEGQGTSIWQLCKTSLKLIQTDFYWTPGNGKKIKVWDDRILGNPPLSSLPSIENLSKWAIDNGFLTLFNLSTSDWQGNWNGWEVLHPPEHLKHDVDLLLPLLHGMAPISESSRDSIGWGSNGIYTVK